LQQTVTGTYRYLLNRPGGATLEFLQGPELSPDEAREFLAGRGQTDGTPLLSREWRSDKARQFPQVMTVTALHAEISLRGLDQTSMLAQQDQRMKAFDGQSLPLEKLFKHAFTAC
jgi:hypothetical protein